MTSRPMERHGKAWARERFRGFENFLIPSFSRDLRRLDEHGIRRDVNQSVRHGVFSSRCALEAGLTKDEQQRMLEVVADEAAGRIGISVTLLGESIEENVATLRWVEAAGATHAQLVLPQSFHPALEDEVYRFVRAVAEATSLAICLSATASEALAHLHPSGLPLGAYERLAEIDNVVALELGMLDAGLVLECCERLQERLLVTSLQFGMLPMLCENFGVAWGGAWTLEGLQSPGDPRAVRFLDLLRQHKLQEAMRIYWSLAPALGAISRVIAQPLATGTPVWPLLKYQQWLSGGNGGMTRQPCMRLFERDMQALRAGLRAAGVECPDPDDEFFAGRCNPAPAARRSEGGR